MLVPLAGSFRALLIIWGGGRGQGSSPATSTCFAGCITGRLLLKANMHRKFLANQKRWSVNTVKISYSIGPILTLIELARSCAPVRVLVLGYLN
jgi:hypothetical protein